MAVAEGTGEVAVVATEVVGVDTEGAVVGTREVFNSAILIAICVLRCKLLQLLNTQKNVVCTISHHQFAG